MRKKNTGWCVLFEGVIQKIAHRFFLMISLDLQHKQPLVKLLKSIMVFFCFFQRKVSLADYSNASSQNIFIIG